MKDGEQKIEVQGSIDLDLKKCRGSFHYGLWLKFQGLTLKKV